MIVEGNQSRMGAIPRCVPYCEDIFNLVNAAQVGARPFIIGGGRVYQYMEGTWLQSLWP